MEGTSSLIFEQPQDTEGINELDRQWLYKSENLHRVHMSGEAYEYHPLDCKSLSPEPNKKLLYLRTENGGCSKAVDKRV